LKRALAFLLLAAALSCAGCATPATTPIPAPPAGFGSQGDRVQGTVTSRVRVALSPNAVVEVKLLDVSLQDVAPVTLGLQIIETRGRQFPIPFRIPYDPAWIDPMGRYAVQGRVTESGQPLLLNIREVPVLTGGAPATVEIEVGPVP